MVETTLHCGNSIKILEKYPDNYFNLIITSPPYADARKKHYLSIHPEKYPVFFKAFHKEFWRVLTNNGSFVLNLKDKVVDGVRHRYVWHTINMLSSLGWKCIDDYIWHKPNAMPGYWPNRLRDEWEYCFHMTKQTKFAMYQDAVKKSIGKWAETRLKKLNEKRHNSENNSGFGRDLTKWVDKKKVLPGNTLNIPLVGKNMGHPAVFPEKLPQFFIKLFTKEGDRVLDPFAGSGTTGVASQKLKRNSVLIDSEDKYLNVMEKRLKVKRSINV
jgi:site-specific DNA-methyltransferase (adenine-specific)/site-specific DNA-methyltransferase (cytosine-N4-specific)